MYRFFISILLFGIFLGCSAKKTPSEPSQDINSLLNDAWKDYAEFRFSDAREKFYNIVNFDAQNLEAYYGLSLSSLSIGIYNEAYSLSTIGASVNGNEIYSDEGQIILDNTNYSNYYDTLKISGNIYAWRIKLPARNIVNIVHIKRGLNPIEYSTYYDSLIIGVSDFSALLKVGDTISYFVQRTSKDPIDVHKWHLFAVASAAYFYDGKLKEATQNVIIPLYRDKVGNFEPRVVKKFNPSDIILLALYISNSNKDYISMANMLNKYLNGNWPTNNDGWNCGSWSLSLCDVKWVYENVNKVKDKFYEVVSQKP